MKVNYKLLFFILIFNLNAEKYQFYSQFGQDKFVFKNFKNKKNGTFVEIGAFDGIEFSNTYFFEKFLNWKGICIEPIPYLYEQLIKNRKSLNLNCAIWNIDGYATFLEPRFADGSNHGWGGIVATYDIRHKNELINKWQKKNKCSVKETEVFCRQLNKICEEQKINHIDFLSIDTEGSELDILKSIDFSKLSIDIITVEDNFNDTNITAFLKTKGFDFVTRLGVDNIYKKIN